MVLIMLAFARILSDSKPCTEGLNRIYDNARTDQSINEFEVRSNRMHLFLLIIVF